MSKKWLFIFLPLTFLAFTIWKAWPKVMPIPESEKSKLFGKDDFEKILGKPIAEVALKDGKFYRYTETLFNGGALRGIMTKGMIGDSVYEFVSNYQVFPKENDAKKLYEGNALLGKLPGIKKEEFKIKEFEKPIEVFSGNGSIFISAANKNVYYSIQIEPELKFDGKATVGIISEKILKIQSSING